MKTFILALSSFMLVSAGKCSKNAVPAQDRTPLVQLQTHGCRGYCPTYKLLVFSDGMMAYEGIRNMVKMGKDTVRLSSDEIKLLRKIVNDVNLWQYPEQIESRVADAPSSTLTAFDGGKEHGVSGSIDRPKPILDLEHMLIDLAEAHGLKVKQGVSPYEPPPNQQEILVKFKPDVNPGNFMMKIEEIRLRIVRRVSAENLWIIGYNPDQISEKQLIEMLKGMDGVLDAGPNKKN